VRIGSGWALARGEESEGVLEGQMSSGKGTMLEEKLPPGSARLCAVLPRKGWKSSRVRLLKTRLAQRRTNAW